MQTETPSRGGESVASLSGVSVRRARGHENRKNSDITAALAALPPEPEILPEGKAVHPEHRAGNLRDVTPEAPAMPADILAYWNTLRAAKAMPSRDLLRASEVAPRWPNLILFRCTGKPGQLRPDTAFSTALRANRGADAAAHVPGTEISALLSQWMLKVAQAASSGSVAVRDRSHLDTLEGRVRYAVTALPFGDDPASPPDHVLCHVAPT